MPRHGIRIRNLCFVTQIVVKPNGRDSQVSWQLEGAWNRIPNATLVLHLQQNIGGRWNDIARLVKSISADAGSAAVDLSGHTGKQHRIMIRREGDPETGGASRACSLN